MSLLWYTVFYIAPVGRRWSTPMRLGDRALYVIFRRQPQQTELAVSISQTDFYPRQLKTQIFYLVFAQ